MNLEEEIEVIYIDKECEEIKIKIKNQIANKLFIMGLLQTIRAHRFKYLFLLSEEGFKYLKIKNNIKDF